MATKRGADEAGPAPGSNRPAHEVRIGRALYTLWANRHETLGMWYSMTFHCTFKQGDEWKNATTFGRDDLLVVAEVARQAFLWIARQSGRFGLEGPGDAPSVTVPP